MQERVTVFLFRLTCTVHLSFWNFVGFWISDRYRAFWRFVLKLLSQKDYIPDDTPDDTLDYIPDYILADDSNAIDMILVVMMIRTTFIMLMLIIIIFKLLIIIPMIIALRMMVRQWSLKSLYTHVYNDLTSCFW